MEHHMLKLKYNRLFLPLFIAFLFLLGGAFPADADDTCMFTVSSGEVAPNIVFLLDNGASMEQIKWHGDYDNNTDYTPDGANIEVVDGSAASPGGGTTNTILVLTDVDENYPFEVNSDIQGVTSGATANIASKSYVGDELHLEIVSAVGTFSIGETVQRYKNINNIATGTLTRIEEPEDPEDPEDPSPVEGFLNEHGYALVEHGGIWALVKILSTLVPDSYTNGLDADSGSTWTINGRPITLPAQPSSSGQTDAVTGLTIIDNASRFRFSKNYLNWLFFGSYSGDGTDLPDKSRFYYAKQALLSVGKLTSNKANFGIYNFTATTLGASSVQPLGEVVATVVEGDPQSNVLTSNYINNINNMGTVTYSPLAEGLATIGGFYNSSSSGVESQYYCQDQYVIVVSSGLPSYDQEVTEGGNTFLPNSLEDFDGDDAGIGEGYVKADSTVFPIPQNDNGSTWLDDVAHYLFTHDMVGYVDGFQNVMTYTVGVMTSNVSNLFLTNTSNNGNGHPNLYDTTDSDYGDYHFTADSAEDLSTAILAAVNAILTGTSTFTAPVVPVTRTLSGNHIYLALFTPQEGNFWKGNVLKFGLDDELNVVDKGGNPATESNGAIKASAEPYWATINWSNADYAYPDCIGEGCNYIENTDRNIYTYLGTSTDLTHASNAFDTDNTAITATLLGNPVDGVNTVISFFRGADALDEDGDGDVDENREIMTGDVLHSEPAIFEYRYSNGTAKTYVFFGANDGMVHAVRDQETSASNTQTNYGTESWGFIPPDQLPRLKEMLEGASHPYYVDSTPKIYFSDVDGDGYVDTGDGDTVTLICGERKGGTTYVALDITVPASPQFKWQINSSSVSTLGESWSEPAFGVVKTSGTDTTGTPVMFIGGGYSQTNSAGKAILAVKVTDGSVLNQWYPDFNLSADSAMTCSIPGTVNPIDEDSDGFVDKLYVGDVCGRIWRVGSFVDAATSLPLVFPECDENINTWKAQIVFTSPSSSYRFFYAPRVTFEIGYDLVFGGTGDREDACSTSSGPDMILAFKDVHGTSSVTGSPVPVTQTDLVNTSVAGATSPNLDNPTGDVDGNNAIDNGWYFSLVTGEKVLSEGAVFFKTVYMTTFLPNNDPCLPGGEARIYALGYKTGDPVIDFDPEGEGETPENEPYKSIGGGIPSEPVIVISETGPKLLITIGTPTPDDDVDTDDQPGIIEIDPLAPTKNFFYLWWRESE